MADTTRDLVIRTSVTGAPESKAALDSIKQSTDGVVVGTAERAAASTAAAAATVAAESTVILALREARAAMAALAAATTVGGAEMTAAVGRAAIAVAGLQAEILAVKASGGIVTPAQMTGLATYQSQLTGLIGQMGATSAATTGAVGGTRLYTSATAAAGQAIAGKTASLGALTAGMLRFIGPVGAVIAVITLIPAAIKLVIDKTNEWSTKLGETIAGLNEQDGVIRKAGESTVAYTARANAAADAQATFERAVKATDAGFIVNTGNVEKMSAAYVLHQAAARGNVPPTKEFEAAAKALGITLTATYSGATRQAVLTFMEIYAAKLKEGEASAEEFAQANKTAIGEWIQAFQNAKQEIPPVLTDLAAKMDVLTIQQRAVKAELEASIAPLRAYWAEMNKAREETGEFADASQRLKEMSAEFIFDFATGARLAAEELKGVTVEARELVVALREVDAASDAVFPVISGGHSQLGPQTGVPPIT